ncbi:MAG TPA: DUF72 domain-containing protein [Candidatus Limosilactobacillus faecipullorum]|nr:DUF72 domain-containing protein [Candidatus Limosilactobacillus faecipullorum]
MKVTVGLTTWSEHHALIHAQRPVTLNEYAQHFPVVEVDTFFYALPQVTTVQKWLGEVSPDFQFIVKAHQTMTKHPQAQLPNGQSLAEMFKLFTRTVAPLVATDQLKTVLFQFPPTFTATPINIEYLMQIRKWLSTLPIAIEFRHQSWYRQGVLASLIGYCQELKFTLVAVDEPHQLPTSVPFELVTTNPQLGLIRLHGRNTQGWNHQGSDWRKKRTLYSYSKEELAGLKTVIEQLSPQPQELCVIFNNNSGGDAAPNAQELTRQMNLHFSGLVPRAPEQLDLF